LSRIRTIKPEWLDDERMSSCSPEARVLSVALILLADDHGRGRAGRMWLLGRVFPGMALETLTRACDELGAWYVHFYEVNEQAYFEVNNWDKHQRVERPGAEKVPRPNPETTRIFNEIPSVANARESSRECGEESRSIATSGASLSSGSNSGSYSGSGSLSQASPDQPDKSGSARARRKPGAKSEHIPFAMHDAFTVPEELVLALAEQYEVTPERIAATLPEFRFFWKRRGDRKKQAGWERAFRANVERNAKSGVLFLKPRALPTAGGHAAVFARAAGIVGGGS
jgi:hypothetical protein